MFFIKRKKDFLPKKVATKKLHEWLISLASEDSAYHGYYTMRKKVILDEMSNGIEPDRYWEYVGRLKELKQLNSFSLEALKKNKNEREKKKK